jgi:hypothetical protein
MTVVNYLETLPPWIISAVVVVVTAVYFWQKRNSTADGLMKPYEAEISFPDTKSPEQTEQGRDLERCFAGDGIYVEMNGKTLSLRSYINDISDLTHLLNRWFPGSDSEALVASSRAFFSVGGILQAMVKTPFGISVHQPIRLFRVEPGIMLKLCVLGFAGSPVMGEPPDDKYTPWGLRIESGNLTLEGEVLVRIKIFPSKKRKSSLTLLVD